MVGEDFRPFVETEEIAFNTELRFDVGFDEEFSLTKPKYREPISRYVQAINDQQPEIDVGGGDVYQFEQVFYRTQRGSITSAERDGVAKIVNVTLDMRLDEVVVVFSHILDSQRIVEQEYNYVEGVDSRVIERGILRDQRDSERRTGDIVDSLPVTFFV